MSNRSRRLRFFSVLVVGLALAIVDPHRRGGAFTKPSDTLSHPPWRMVLWYALLGVVAWQAGQASSASTGTICSSPIT
jgi:RsiW-degrading membrane proteinase PrsW (M82 family)